MSLFEKAWMLILLTVAVLSLSACSSGPPPKLYLLDADLVDVSTDNMPTSSIMSLGISQITLPGYASDSKIASSSGDGLVVLLDEQRWAEEPEDAITRLLSQRLRARAGATVLVEPWPRDFEPQARVEVVFDRLLSEAAGGAHLSGQIHLLSANGRRLLQSVPFDFRTAGRPANITDFFKAVATGVDNIAVRAVDTLIAMKTNG